MYEQPTGLIEELVGKLSVGDSSFKYETSDGKHFYISSKERSIKVRIADHSYVSGAGKAYGHVPPDIEVVFSENMTLLQQRQLFWQEVEHLIEPE